MGAQRGSPQHICNVTPSKRVRARDADFRFAKFTCPKPKVLLAVFRHYDWSQSTMIQQIKKWFHGARGDYQFIPSSEVEAGTPQDDTEVHRAQIKSSRSKAMLVLYSTLVLYLSLTLYFGSRAKGAHAEDRTYTDSNSQHVNVL